MKELPDKVRILEKELKQLVEDFENENKLKIIFIDKLDSLKPTALVRWLE